MKNDKIKLVSFEGDEFIVDKYTASMSTVILNILEVMTAEEDTIPLPNIKTPILKKIIEYMEYHINNPAEEIPKPLITSNLQDVVSSWDYDFVNTDKETLYELIEASNYLDIKPLLDLTCGKIASMMKDKTTEEIRAEFDIVNDFTREEEKQVGYGKKTDGAVTSEEVTRDEGLTNVCVCSSRWAVPRPTKGLKKTSAKGKKQAGETKQTKQHRRSRPSSTDEAVQKKQSRRSRQYEADQTDHIN
ncbi:suppressor of kinetochore protein 1, putative [Plasmodium vivax]|uniref:Suppressor of kinetochore protein 1, putative n=1 Tax=Plasmodium vivax TaxID=5855 RepID=A0A1G4GZC4_PLAVI|nr:suppressor of kinetochore protein 1, putative [Plasmodium vivax]